MSTSAWGLAEAWATGAGGGAARFRDAATPTATIAIAAAPNSARREAGIVLSVIAIPSFFVASVTSEPIGLW
ncbi:hypothetical protein SCH01S_01_01020 [Sphingomonas changbaiensis NBRC 104936]|uniref:Uncharacterized protein n=1 Tax=Sphingomonas changbaiensis NBRC 104936 TaxID=1219043 RepID=A0A0E9MK84_9SPHN|nr:hypothetical protein SCH01S_01_01020 [Sphingomonas changbaiensis NBRC 104936]